MKPLVLPPKPGFWIVAGFRTTRETLRQQLGMPHYVETDVRCTCGGEEDQWYYESETGQRLMMQMKVPYGVAVIMADPPNAKSAIEAFATVVDPLSIKIIDPPELV